MVSATIFEAKTKLSELIKTARGGETVIITSGREKRPVARIEPIPAAAKPKRLGLLEKPGFVFPESFWDPLTEEELRLWNGEGE